jgi:hypothetical protein
MAGVNMASTYPSDLIQAMKSAEVPIDINNVGYRTYKDVPVQEARDENGNLVGYAPKTGAQINAGLSGLGGFAPAFYSADQLTKDENGNLVYRQNLTTPEIYDKSTGLAIDPNYSVDQGNNYFKNYKLGWDPEKNQLTTDVSYNQWQGGGGFGDFVRDALIGASLFYGGGAIADALGAGTAAGAETAAAAADAAAPIAESAAPAFTAELPAGSQYVAPAVGQGVQVASAAPGAGLEALPTGTPLSSVGENAYTASQDAIDATGASNAGGGAMTNAEAIGAQNAYPAANAAAAGAAAANAANAASGGSSLASILPYTTAASVGGALLQANAAQKAADAQTAAANNAIAQQQANFNLINQQQAPYRATGYNALNQIAQLGSGQTPTYDYQGNLVKDASGNPVMQTGSGYLTHQFNAADLAAGLAPNYDFMLQQGQMANQRAANATGGGLGGNALQGLNKFTQDYAGNAYQNAFNNYQTQRNNIYNTLANMAGIGQTGQSATNTAATNATNAATQLGIGSAAAQSGATTGSANAYGNAINNATNNYTLASLLNQRGNVQLPTS